MATIGKARPSKDIPLIRPSVGEEELREIRSVLESGWLAQGPKVREFEQKFAAFVGAKYAVATSSCTTALSLAIESLQLKQGTEVLVPDFTFPATANVVIRAGLKPVLVDVERDTYGMSPSETNKAFGRRTSALMPVHPFGHPFEKEELYELANKHGAEVIEDAATATGTKYEGARVGSWGRAVCFSFHPRKLLTTAEGGCLTTDDEAVYQRAMAMRSHGQVTKDGRASFVLNGLNYRMSDVHAAIGVAQLGKMERIIRSRRGQAKAYDDLLTESKLDLRLPVEREGAFHTYQSYVVVLGRSFPESYEVIPLLKKKFGIETQIGTYALSAQPSFRGVRTVGTLKNSQELYRHSLTLPMYEGLSGEEQDRVVESLGSLSRA